MSQAAAARGEGGNLTSWPAPCVAGCCRRYPDAQDIPAVSGGDVESVAAGADVVDAEPGGVDFVPSGSASAVDRPGPEAVELETPPSPYNPLTKETPMSDHSSADSVIEGPRDDEVPAGSYTAPTDPRDTPVIPEEVNASSKWAMYSVFRVATALPAEDDERRRLVEGSDEWAGQSGVDTRGWYDLSGLRANADLLVWWVSDDPAVLQDAYHRFRASAGAHLEPVCRT